MMDDEKATLTVTYRDAFGFDATVSSRSIACRDDALDLFEHALRAAGFVCPFGSLTINDKP